jgi:hypothetical protein
MLEVWGETMMLTLPRRRTEADYNDLARSRGIEWLGQTLPANTRYCKTKWRCKCRHTWLTTFATIQAGSSCPKCSRKRMIEKKRKTQADYHRLADSIGFSFVGTLPQGTHVQTTWMCQNGHRIFKTYSSLRAGQNCKHCSIQRRSLQMSDYRAVEQINGLKFTGRRVPKNVFTPGRWLCPNGCTLEKAYRHVSKYAGCPNCPPYRNGKLVSQAQVQIGEMLGGELNFVIDDHRVDVALVDERIAIEYDGWHWHAHKSLEDRRRNKRIRKSGWKLLVIKSNSRIPTIKQLEFHLTKLRAGDQKRVLRLSDWGVGNTLAGRVNGGKK